METEKQKKRRESKNSKDQYQAVICIALSLKLGLIPSVCWGPTFVEVCSQRAVDDMLSILSQQGLKDSLVRPVLWFEAARDRLLWDHRVMGIYRHDGLEVFRGQ